MLTWGSSTRVVWCLFVPGVPRDYITSRHLKFRNNVWLLHAGHNITCLHEPVLFSTMSTVHWLCHPYSELRKFPRAWPSELPSLLYMYCARLWVVSSLGHNPQFFIQGFREMRLSDLSQVWIYLCWIIALPTTEPFHSDVTSSFVLITAILVLG